MAKLRFLGENHINSNPLKIIAAFVAGLLTNLAFEPFGLFPVIFFTLAVLFWIWDRSNASVAAWSGFVFGLGFYGFGIHWIYNSLHDYGGAAPVLAGFMVFALVCFLAVLIAACGKLQARWQTTTIIRCLIVIPASWVVVEWMRSWLLTGFPWLYVGYSQTDNWLAGWAPFGGVFTVSFMVCVLAGVLVCLLKTQQRLNLLVLVLNVVVIGYWGSTREWTDSVLAPIDVAVIQADISVEEKWEVNRARRNFEFFVKQSEALGTPEGPDLIIWPEIALANTDKHLEKLQLWRLLMNLSPDFLIGVVEEQQQGETDVYYNSAFGITDEVQKYRKRRLVPFGEFTPMRSLLGWLDNFIEIPASDFTSYKENQSPMMLAGQPVGVSICYEDAFPQEILNMLPKSTFLINISEDAWFGEWLSPYQRLQMSRMRAMETARPVVRAANQGISAAIDHKGEISAVLPQSAGHVMAAQIRPTTGATFYVRYGDTPVIVLCVGLLILIVLRAKPSRSSA